MGVACVLWSRETGVTSRNVSGSHEFAPAAAAHTCVPAQVRMDFYSNDPKADTINRVRGEISEVRSVMVDNIDKARHGCNLQASKHLPAVVVCCAWC